MARTDDNWIQSFTGRQVWPLDPRLEDIDIRDIAHHLAMKCRFTGAVKRFYSVAQHCVIGSRYIAPEHALWFLLHDAPEAYLFDAARPIKAERPFIKEDENRLMACIAAKFELPMPEPEAVKQMDYVMLRTERRDFMNAPPRPWADRGYEPLAETLVSWDPDKAEAEYLMQFGNLLRMRLRSICE